ncbi:MAG TPA: hypothetical protein GXX29_09920 [Firmicutes bacterium]|nr:hypothetical protein [Bacillota bacterium]
MKAAVRRAWVLNNLEAIGTGGFYHLAYAHNQICPQFIQQLKNESDYGKINIYLLSDDNSALLAATGEVFAVHWFPEFIRLHFMIEKVYSLEEAPRTEWHMEYMLCR